VIELHVFNRKLAKSFEYWNRAEELIPCGTQTLSKGPDQFVKGVYPIYLKSGKGSHVFDVDGNEYIDYPMALGPIILGYSYPRVNQAIEDQLKDGIIFSVMHPLEVEVAELLRETVPCAEMVRFGKNGSDVTSAAVRASRAFTGREKVAFCGYHGWQDWYAVTTSRAEGIPKVLKGLTIPFEYNKIETLERVFAENRNEIAAVIMEPVGLEEPKDDFLKKVRDLTHENGALLIFDEVLTGFRLALGGAQEYFGVIPDLACVGKAVANGMPLSAVVGKEEIMKVFEKVFFSFTFGGETLSLAAAVATINEMKERYVIGHIWKQGKKLQDGYNKLAQELDLNTRCIGLAAKPGLVFKDESGKESLEIKSLFFQECIKRELLFGNATYISYSHSNEDISRTLEVCWEALDILKKTVDRKAVMEMLEGEVAKVVFRIHGH
jgi:glutamate-1-semialdehyde 2,1-aminomutase/spore coat polysaccharide biosynthesis protein SpsF